MKQLLYALGIILVAVGSSAFAQTATAPSGAGTEGSPYLIASLNNLYWVTQNPDSWDKHFLQTEAIDASPTTTWDGGAGFLPIGNPTTPFSGVYSGDNKFISGLFINRGGSNSVGMFGLVSGGQILGMYVSVNITGASSVGGIAGLIQMGSTVQSCQVSGSVTGTGNNVGGVVGSNISSSMVNCANASTVTGVIQVGGVVGNTIDISGDPIIEYSANVGNVSGENSAGGLAGMLQSGTIVSNCYNHGNVARTSGTETALGAFVGTNSGGQIRHSYSIGDVNFGSSKGFVGLTSGSGVVYTANFFDEEKSNQTSGTGASAVTTAEMKSAITYLAPGWDYTRWNIDPSVNSGYPILGWIYSGPSLLEAVKPAGDGTIGNPYQVGSLSDLFWIMETASSWSGYFTQTSDIDAPSMNFWLGGAGFSPIGNLTTPFTGVYDGAGHTVNGLFINRGGTEDVGFFGFVDDAEIKDLGMSNVTLTGLHSVGGLVGSINASTVTNCYSTGTVTGLGNSIGGLVGSSSGLTVISKSYSTANVNGVSHTGGFVGLHFDGSTISNCYSRGNVVRSSGDVLLFGSFMGHGESAIEYCYSTGTVNVGTTNGFGGGGTPTPVTSNFFDSQTSGQATGSGATAKTTAEMQSASTFLAGDWDTDVWNLGDGINDGYPYLDWQNPGGTPLSAALIPPNGSGTEGDPYLIATLGDLYWITQNTSSWDEHFKQTADIDASSTSTWDGGAGFTPIGNLVTDDFSGVYDGDGHTITGLFISRTGTSHVGFFGRTFGGEVRNVGLVDVDITGSTSVGGLVGSHVTGSMIDKCFVTGVVRGTGTVGGLAGNIGNASMINESYSRANVVRVSGSNPAVAGFTGSNDGSTIQYSYSTGSVSFGTGQGFVGTEFGSPTYAGNFLDSEASGQTTGTGATSKTTAEMKTQSTFLDSGWVDTVWHMGDGINDGYPYLHWQNAGGTPLPVQMSTFAAAATGLNAELKWRTEAETDNYGWEVERRVVDEGRWKMEDGKVEMEDGNQRSEVRGQRSEANDSQFTIHDSQPWIVVGFVSGSGTSSSPRDYAFVDKPAEPGRYAYRIKQIDRSGAFTYTAALEVVVGVAPLEFTLSQNYPNPFNPTTTIEFTLPADGHVVLKVYDLVGREVATLVDQEMKAGVYQQIAFDASRLASGLYFARVQAGGKALVKKMLLVR